MRTFRDRIFSREIIFLVVILLASLIIRWRDIENIPYGVENDEFSWIATSLFHQNNIVASEKGIWSLHDTNAQRFPVSVAINQISFKLFGIDFLSPRKILILIHIISLIFFYLLARKFITNNAALLVTLLYSFSVYKLIASRIVIPNFFSELFVYPVLLLLLSINPKNLIRNFIYTFISGISMFLSILTYNLAYMLPFVSIATILFTAVIKKISIKTTILLIILFLLPLILFYQKWLIEINGEAADKSYALVNIAYDLKEKKIYIDRFIKNINAVKDSLFISLRYSTNDMVVSFPGPLVNKWVSLGFLLGMIFALFNLKKYFTLVAWILISSFTYHIIIGLLYPRWWILTVGIIYLFFGIAIDKICELGSKKKLVYLLIWITVLILSSYVIYKDLFIYYKHAVYNSAFLGPHRELVDITEKWKNDLGKRLLVIIPNSSPTNVNTAYTAVSFNYISLKPEQAIHLKNANRTELGVLTDQEFIQKYKMYLVTKKTFIIDNRVIPEIKNLIKENHLCNNVINTHQYFTEINLICK